jgi:hypothetical protein
MRGLKTWLTFGSLALVLALAGCAANSFVQRADNLDQKTWDTIKVSQPSGENTDMELWADMRGGG